MTRHTALYLRLKADHRCVICAGPLPEAWGLVRCQACNRRLRSNARKRWRRDHPVKTEAEVEAMRQKAQRARLEGRYGAIVDGFVSKGVVSRASLLALIAASEQRGYATGWHVGYKAGRKRSAERAA